MNEIVLNILLVPLAIVMYGSGLLLWPIRRWLHRKQKIRGRFLAIVFIVQLVSYVAVACSSAFVRLGHFYYWFIVLIELNIVFTLIGVFAWIRDARYEHSAKLSHVAQQDASSELQ
jgi:hypothetical protein